MDIRIEHLCKKYGNEAVLEDFSYTFKEGKTTCIMGKSGAGKTTLLSILMGLEKADSGEIHGLEGKKFSAVFQENRLLEQLDAVDNVRIATGAAEKEIKNLLRELELPLDERKAVKNYSGGMKRRVAIARALLADYDVLFLDEPLKGLDEATRECVANVIKQRTTGKTVLMITHEPWECNFFGAFYCEIR